MKEDIDEIRHRIQALDAEVISRLAERFRLVRRLGGLKQDLGLPVEDLARERELASWHESMAASRGCDPVRIRRIFSTVLDESKRMQVNELSKAG